MSTMRAYHDECGGYHEYSGGCSVHWGDIMSTPGGVQYTGHTMWGVIMSTPGDDQYTGEIR